MAPTGEHTRKLDGPKTHSETRMEVLVDVGRSSSHWSARALQRPALHLLRLLQGAGGQQQGGQGVQAAQRILSQTPPSAWAGKWIMAETYIQVIDSKAKNGWPWPWF